MKTLLAERVEFQGFLLDFNRELTGFEANPPSLAPGPELRGRRRYGGQVGATSCVGWGNLGFGGSSPAQFWDGAVGMSCHSLRNGTSLESILACGIAGFLLIFASDRAAKEFETPILGQVFFVGYFGCEPASLLLLQRDRLRGLDAETPPRLQLQAFYRFLRSVIKDHRPLAGVYQKNDSLS